MKGRDNFERILEEVKGDTQVLLNTFDADPGMLTKSKMKEYLEFVNKQVKTLKSIVEYNNFPPGTDRFTQHLNEMGNSIVKLANAIKTNAITPALFSQEMNSIVIHINAVENSSTFIPKN